MEENYLTHIDFCGCLFGYLVNKNIRIFNSNRLETHLKNSINFDEYLFTLFIDIDIDTVIQEGINFYQTIDGVCMDLTSSNVIITLNKDDSSKLIEDVPLQYREGIELLANSFQKEKVKVNVK